MPFRLSDYLFTPRDIAAGIRHAYERRIAYHFVDAAAVIVALTLMRALDITGTSIVALLFVTWKFASDEMQLHDILDLVSLSLLAIILHSAGDLPEEPLFFFSFTLILFRFRLDARVSIGAALVCLIAIPVSLILFQLRWWLAGEIWAEKIAVWAYYFLAIGVVKQIYEMMLARREEKI